MVKNSGTTLLLFWLISTVVCAQGKKEGTYQYTIDLTRVSNDQVYVELSPPRTGKSEIEFFMPRIIPGTYAIADYGRYITGFEARDRKGKKLRVEKTTENSWKIKNAKNLATISYRVDDSWDTSVSGPEIFWPAGTNIEASTNFVLNPAGFMGYIEGFKDNPFRLKIIHPATMYGTTGLVPEDEEMNNQKVDKERATASGVSSDVFVTKDYDELVDAPIMYAQPDTAIIYVGDTEVLIGAYSPTKKITAKEIAAATQEVLMAQQRFLGGKLPVEKYAFIFYFTDKPVLSYGALEHSYSSMYYMPEMPLDQMKQQLRDFAAHEFFHIITPLTIHSEEIENFDYNDPKMSRHLWLYEGVTEYFAGLVQVKYDLISGEQFLATLQEKMLTADKFRNDVPFTDISRFTLEKYKDQYYNVYQKGALIGLCLDLKLRKLSEGKKGLQDLMMDLSKKYGKNKAFDDDKLFKEIEELTAPEIGDFFKKYVAGTEPLPLSELLQDFGIEYIEQQRFEDYTLGISSENITVTEVDGKPRLQITSVDKLDSMGQSLNFREGDILQEINGQKIPDLGPEFGPFIQTQMLALGEGKTLSYTVLRKDASGQPQQVVLSAPSKKVLLERRHLIRFDAQPTEEQMKLRTAWLRPQ